jgi:hypothetical protein
MYGATIVMMSAAFIGIPGNNGLLYAVGAFVVTLATLFPFAYEYRTEYQRVGIFVAGLCVFVAQFTLFALGMHNTLLHALHLI